VKDLRSHFSIGDVDRVRKAIWGALIHAYLVWRRTGKIAGDDKTRPRSESGHQHPPN
jgi:peptide chain release factor 2